MHIREWKEREGEMRVQPWICATLIARTQEEGRPDGGKPANRQQNIAVLVDFKHLHVWHAWQLSETAAVVRR